VLIEPAGLASYCSPICAAKIKGSALVCGGSSSSYYSDSCRSDSKRAASCDCQNPELEFMLNPALQTDRLSGIKYYTGTCVCSAAGVYTVPSPYGGPPACAGESDSSNLLT
jgi:hypothetical protein